MDPNDQSVAEGANGQGAAAADQTADNPLVMSREEVRRLWMSAGVVVGLILFAGFVGGLLLRVPYVALVPGSARDTEPLLAVGGIEEYPSDGELLFTTVRLRQRPNLWEYLWLTADSDAEVFPEERILEDRTPEENREFNLAKMEDSKRVAVAVALEELGYEAITTDGVVVRQVVEDEAAEGVLDPGDTIVAVDGVPTMAADELVDELTDRKPGDEVSLTVESFETGETRTEVIELGNHPDQDGRGFLGILPESRPNYGGNVGFDVEIDSGSVGGPSAGLAFTLAVLDQLTEGELTGGATVAVTGSIHPGGAVGPVGGVRQKTAVVRSLGADAFIVPASLGEEELAAVFERAGDELTVIPVENVEEALEALAEIGGEVDAVAEYAAANPGSVG